MAIGMAQQGGLGIIHRFMTVERQAEMVKNVKRHETHIILNPYRIHYSSGFNELKALMKKTGVGSILVTDDSNTKLVGLITNRDIDFAYLKYGKKKDMEDVKVKEYMIPREKLVVIKNRDVDEARELMFKTKKKKILIVDDEDNIDGLITLRDIVKSIKRPYASLDKNGSLLVGAAVGVKSDYMKRSKALVDAGVDILCVDIAHGDSKLGCETVTLLKKSFPTVEIMAGSVATGAGTERLIKAGADCIRVGVGSGSICTTRIVTGFGVPQLSAVFECAKIGKAKGVTVISDGGTSGKSGNMVKALAAGAGAVMLGSTLAGSEESPGKVITKGKRRVKMIRGMAGTISNMKRGFEGIEKMTPEGVEGYVSYSGPLRDLISKLVGGLQSGISYAGGHDLKELYKNAEFIRITKAGQRESTHHDIQAI